MPKALIVVTNIGKFPKEDKATGSDFPETAHVYEKLTKAGWTVDFVSPLGGYVPIDPKSI
jgi:putative intracellular protease/amidase